MAAGRALGQPQGRPQPASPRVCAPRDPELAEQALQGLDPLANGDAHLLFVTRNAQRDRRRWEASVPRAVDAERAGCLTFRGRVAWNSRPPVWPQIGVEGHCFPG